MKAICHIGHHKTGTTSLQAYLSQNSNALLNAGIHYPWVDTQGAALALAKASGGSWSDHRRALSGLIRGDRAEILPINFREAHNALAFRMLTDTVSHWRVPPYHSNLPHSRQMLLGLKNQLEYIAPETVILCSEVMSHFGKQNPDLITTLRKALSAANEFTIWCTLRRPDQQAASWHAQQVRFGQAPKPLSAPGGVDFDWLHFDYQGVIEPWVQKLPEANLVLRPYAEVMAQGGSVEDLKRHSGVHFPRALLPEMTMNISLPPAVVGLIREGNKALPRPLATEFAKDIVPLANDISQPTSKDVEYFGSEIRQQMAARFAPVHDAISRLSGRKRFFDDIDGMLQCRPIPESDAIRQLLDGLADRTERLESPELREFLAGMIRDYGRVGRIA